MKRKLKTKIKAPKGATIIKPDHRGHVLAEGEVTGHYHGIEETTDAELYRLGEALLLANTKEVPLKHQEHKPVIIKPGLWETGGVMEFDHLRQMERKVID